MDTKFLTFKDFLIRESNLTEFVVEYYFSRVGRPNLDQIVSDSVEVSTHTHQDGTDTMTVWVEYYGYADDCGHCEDLGITEGVCEDKSVQLVGEFKIFTEWKPKTS